MRENIILDVDSYKASQFLQYPPNSEYVNSYIESRGGEWDQTVFFGLQMALIEYLSDPITMEDIEEAEEVFASHGEPFNKEGWLYILDTYNGYLPVEIQAVPEGTVVPVSNVLVQVVNTDPKCFWLTSYIETMLLRAVWYPTTVATNSFMCKKYIYESLKRTSDDPDGQIAFKLHDFGSRGVSSRESAGIGGVAHLVNFMGTDTVEGVMYARKYYAESMAGFSIPASEHSTITSWGGPDQEIDAFKNMLKQFAKPGAMVACVSDSYDIYKASIVWGTELKAQVLESGATLVVRPDSGDPLTVPVEVIEILADKFGYTVNSKGFKVLNPAVRVIQGDGINHKSLQIILENVEAAGYSTDNIAFGMGGGLLQQVDRDTLKWAMKASAIKIDGKWQDVWKQPVGQPDKASKRGVLALRESCGVGSCEYQTLRLEHLQYASYNVLEPVYRNGKVLKTYSLAEVRERANAGLQKLTKVKTLDRF